MRFRCLGALLVTISFLVMASARPRPVRLDGNYVELDIRGVAPSSTSTATCTKAQMKGACTTCAKDAGPTAGSCLLAAATGEFDFIADASCISSLVSLGEHPPVSCKGCVEKYAGEAKKQAEKAGKAVAHAASGATQKAKEEGSKLKDKVSSKIKSLL
ncbi:hypothetical protein BT96DRAFT_997343 [Gymnopus androsaceus JB14]|uniref:Uncharacterized protein n=1 Tax=Gymnopus androsaceus JB14 TaxID=1447944 RepID=A0A6A4HDL7_9AGAR|nr:hypothetical protein BT96DRAFT_997343 [Gymnopus androsaceus JB14]